MRSLPPTFEHRPRRPAAPRRARRVLTLGLALGLLGAVGTMSARADLLLETETRLPAGPADAVRRGRIWLDAERIRLEFSDPSRPGEVATVIFRGDRDLYWALDAASRSYVQIDRAEVIVSFDADFLGTWISPVEFARGWRAGRLPKVPAGGLQAR